MEFKKKILDAALFFILQNLLMQYFVLNWMSMFDYWYKIYHLNYASFFLIMNLNFCNFFFWWICFNFFENIRYFEKKCEPHIFFLPWKIIINYWRQRSSNIFSVSSLKNYDKLLTLKIVKYFFILSTLNFYDVS